MSDSDPVAFGARILMERMAVEARAVLAGTAEPGYGKRLARLALELEPMLAHFPEKVIRFEPAPSRLRRAWIRVKYLDQVLLDGFRTFRLWQR